MFRQRFRPRWLVSPAIAGRNGAGRAPWAAAAGGSAVLLLLLVACTTPEERTVRARVQLRPGGPTEEVDMAIHEAPVDPPSVSAADAPLHDVDLVLGLIVEGQPVAYPIRYLATVEVLNDTVGSTALAPTW